MTSRSVFAAAFAANLLLWGCVAGFAAMRPDYSHLTDAISELGAVDAPNGWAFNLFGYLLPGLLLAAAGWGIGRRTGERRLVLPLLLVLGGGGLVVAGLFPADLDHRQGLATRLHLFGSFMGMATLLAWIVATVQSRKTRPALAVSALVALLLFLAVTPLYGVLHTPGLVQRLTFAIAYGWYLVAAWLLWRPRPAAA